MSISHILNDTPLTLTGTVQSIEIPDNAKGITTVNLQSDVDFDLLDSETDTNGKTYKAGDQIALENWHWKSQTIWVQGSGAGTLKIQYMSGKGDAAIRVQSTGDSGSAAYNKSTGAEQVEVINDAVVAVIGPTTLLNAVTAGGASTAVNPALFHHHTFTIISTGVSAGVTLEIEQSPNNSDWATIAPLVISATGNNTISVENRKYNYMRANITTYGDGTHTVIYNGGN
jgi:hypothetical protein